ncbi:hypothetical protein HRbin36_01056 [bacterium HR36]|nr:hypothetical protein HRbin36_01056 [bacterium HR36]
MRTPTQSVTQRRIKPSHLYLGAALYRIVHHSNFRHLALLGRNLYVVNNVKIVLMKYATKRIKQTRKNCVLYRFTFTPNEMQQLLNYAQQPRNEVLVVLVCRYEAVCLLNWTKFTNLINVNSSKSEWIAVAVRAGGQKSGGIAVSGSSGGNVQVAHSDFPKRIF